MNEGPWLIDKSALVRIPRLADPTLWGDRITRGLVHVSTVTLLEVGFSARSGDDFTALTRTPPVSLFIREYVTPAAERRAVWVQQQLAARGQHRAPSIPDLLIAAIAEQAGLTVLHQDKDFDLIAGITGQAVERLE